MSAPTNESWYQGLRSVVLAGLLAAGAGGYFWYNARPVARPYPVTRASTEQGARASVATRPGSQAGPSVNVAVIATGAVRAPAAADPAPSEATLMSELRALVNRAPEQALALARRGEALFPNSPDAPERAWIAVKSLDLLKRFHEAQAEARLMLRLYPDTPWTEDVERHVLLYPLDQPSREEQQAAMGTSP